MTGVPIKSCVVVILLLLFHFVAFAQGIQAPNDKLPVLSAVVTVSKYTAAQKQLYVLSTAQFINILAQNNLDKDSVMSMACHITGMPFLLPYSDGFADMVSGGEDLINSGRIKEAVQLSKKTTGTKQIQLLLKLGIWYLHQPGSHKNDIDNAGFYIENASKLSTAKPYIKWANECQFLLGELAVQKGKILESREIFRRLVITGQQSGNAEIEARADQCLGAVPDSYSIKRAYYQKSLNLYQRLGLKEKAIELLGYISICDRPVSSDLTEKDFRQIISLMKSTGFKHVLYAENQLTVAFGRQGKYAEAFKHANAAFENMKWSGIDAAASPIYIRFGSLCESLGKNDEALLWYKKALNTRKIETRVFWYKSLLFVTSMLMDTNPRESLSLMDTVTSQFPPQSVWEKLQILSIKGVCYAGLKKTAEADETYMSFLKLSNQFPSEDANGDLVPAYILIGDYYVSRSNVKKARLFLNKANINSLNDIENGARKYSLSYKIDSLEGNYKSAFKNYIKYKQFNDSLVGLDQRKEVAKLTMKFAAEKKDRNIKLLTRQGAMQQAELKQNELIRNIMIAGTVLLLIILLLLFSQFRLKQRINGEMNNSNMALKQLVNEKEWLIKEVHHRVKNNLQTIISLLESQAAYLENDALKAIETSQNRIYAMSLIHQKLYQSEDIQTIDMAIYIPELVTYLKESFDNSDEIDFMINVDQVYLDASIAIPLALIINEALTNSIKYAFPENRNGQILISLRKHGELLNLELADNGIGMDIDSIIDKTVSLGIQLIKGLTKEIRGEISFQNDHGIKITVSFKKYVLEYSNI